MGVKGNKKVLCTISFPLTPISFRKYIIVENLCDIVNVCKAGSGQEVVLNYNLCYGIEHSGSHNV